MALSWESLVSGLIRGGFVLTPAIISAFREIDRRDFVPPEFSTLAYEDRPLPIGLEQTISQPLTVAFMLELLQPRPGDKVLEIGAGSGWQTALLCHIVGPSGKVFAIERIPELKEMAERNADKYGFIREGIARISLGDGAKGLLAEAPFRRIIAAAAGDHVRVAWKEQLKVHGKIVAPVQNTIEVWEKTGANDFNCSEYHGFSFVPLISDEGGNGDRG